MTDADLDLFVSSFGTRTSVGASRGRSGSAVAAVAVRRAERRRSFAGRTPAAVDSQSETLFVEATDAT